MKISEADIIMVPGYTNSGPDHWQSRWQEKMKTARRVEQEDWHKPVVGDWTANLVQAVESSSGNVVLVAHSLGCQVLVQAVHQMQAEQLSKVKGAFIVAPPDVENPSIKPKHLMTFGPYPRKKLPFPSILISSENDHFCDISIAETMATEWGSQFINARENGHLNADSGHGPWPDGLMVFAEFMRHLKAD